MLSIIIPTIGPKRGKNKKYFYKKRYNLTDCLSSICNSNFTDITVIFNACDSSYINEITTKFPQINYVINRLNPGVARSWNIGANIAQHRNICFLNDDCVASPVVLMEMSKKLTSNSEIGIIGSAGSFWSNEEHVSYYESSEFGYADVVSGFCFITRRDVMEAIGYFDTAFTPAGYEEIDFCLRSKQAGYLNAVSPTDYIQHNIVHGVSGVKQTIRYFTQEIDTQDLNERNRDIFIKKWRA
jgi:GT2 family glycosyltransferase